jgi:DNA polymerase III alpha subunit
MAFVTLEDMTGTVEVTVFPEPFKAAAPLLRGREPLIVRGRVDDGDKGRVVLAEDARLLEQSLGAVTGRAKNGGEASACRIRVRADSEPSAQLGVLRKLCEEHPGGVPVFVHVLLPGLEVVVRSRGVSVDATAALSEKVTALLGPSALSVDYA